MSRKKKFFKGIKEQTIITLVMGIMEIAVFSIMSRLLSKTDFGYYAALMGVMAIITSISEAGMGSAIIQRKDASNTFLNTAFTLSWFMGISGSLLVFFAAPFLSTLIADGNLCLPLRIMSISVFLSCISSVATCSLLKDLAFKRVGYYRLISYVLASCIGICMGLYGFGLYAIMAIAILNPMIMNILLYRNQFSKIKFGIQRNEVKEIAYFGGWLTMGVILNSICQQMDRLFLSKWLSVRTLGAYNRPSGFVSTITSKLNGIFDTVLFPMLSNIQDNPTKVKNVFYESTHTLNSYSCLLGAAFFFNAELIINIFFGKEWLDLVPILQIISLSIIFNINGRLVDCFFRSLNMVDTGFYLRLLNTLITFTALYWGTKFDIMGVAVALTLATILTIFLKVYVLSRKIHVSFLKFLWTFVSSMQPLVFICFIGVPYLLFTPHTLLWQMIFVIAFSLLCLFMLLFAPRMISREYAHKYYPAITEKLRIKKKETGL